MALSASLQLRQSQSLVMTPQLMQSIRLLQFSHAELTHFIEQEVERNPLLEFMGTEAAPRSVEGPSSGASALADGADAFQAPMPGERTVSQASQTLTREIDQRYENVFPDDHGGTRADAPELASSWKSMPGGDGARLGEGFDLDDFAATPPTLRDHVNEQIAFTITDPAENLMALELADHLDPAGYLQADLGELGERLGVLPVDLERVIARLQTFDPPGLFARSLSECLALQLSRKNRYDPAMAALVANLELLARRDFATLTRICGVDEEDLLDMLQEIRALDPKPGTRFETGSSELIVPDVLVSPASDGSWHVELNADTLPRVLVNQAYYARVSGSVGKNTAGQEFLSECLQTANWLARSLDQRARTIMKVASEIVRQQDAFLLHGIGHLKPLNLKAVAEAISMHESTVSRVTSNKYMLTPRGVFEMKYFFTVSIASAAGGDAHSAESVRHRIKALIEAETPDGILSDDDLVAQLKGEGVDIARRTVAKYREAMNLPSSVQRRREKKARARMALGA